ncbi:MAG TPA: DegT/DnrJ/EryC1/StrS family aminotransferase [Chitinophagaceae bacterium]|nr:MAG: DegT/DnrJ/EryC1/StrS aminotransferase [Bacteroidetes bacterium OLB11]HMN32111.1 DegT/DnrJ/EryC1/StrS family aminotransferase [Chitinophagaceae bacterium]
MDPLQMVDLKKQYQKIKPAIDEAIQDVIDQTNFINGNQVATFAQNLENYLQVKHVIPCANGTDALQIALMALNLQPGDEVITPSFTYFATVEVVGLLKLTPVFCEVNKDTFTIDVNEIEKLITPKTKAIVPVHLYGQSADMEPLLAIAKKHNLYVVEDNAQGIGGYYQFSDGRKVANGCMGTIGTTSFFPSKNLGCYGDGGALFTNDDELAIKIKMVANHGQQKKYVHEIVGCNSRLDTIQAAILNIKLPQLDSYCAARRKVADYYDSAFANHPKIKVPYRASYSYHVYHQYNIQLHESVDRDQVMAALKEVGIPSMIYYPIPAHKQKVFENNTPKLNNLDLTNQLCKTSIALPIHTEMDEEQLEYITKNFLTIINKF